MYVLFYFFLIVVIFFYVFNYFRPKHEKSNALRTPNCLNCDSKLGSDINFCPVCGQENTSRKISLKQFLSDFLGDFFTFDSKFFKSVVPLIIKPGFLTKEFVSGRRVRYILPLRMYLFVSILYFFVLSLDRVGESFSDPGFENKSVSLETDKGLRIVPIDTLRIMADSLGIDGFLEEFGAESSTEKFLISQLYKVLEKRGEGFVELIYKNVSLLMFILLPIFAFLLFIFFRKKKLFYLEHLIHSFHLHAFIFLFFALYLLFSTYIYDIFNIWLGLLIIFIYTVISFKKVYDYKWRWTVFLGCIIVFVYSIVLIFGIAASVGLSVMVY